MNIEIANKLADGVKIVELRDGFESVGQIVSGIDLSSNALGARVFVDDVVVLDWIVADADTVRAADKIVQERVDTLNDALAKKDFSEAKARLEKAVNEFKSPVGTWAVNATEEGDRLILEWTCEKSHPSVVAMGPDGSGEIDCDAPWTLWGGDAIIAAAGLRQPFNGTCDAYQQYGVNMVSQSVSWSF